MEPKGNFIYFIRNLRSKHRLSLRDQHDQNEVWYVHISPARAMAVILALVLLTFILVITLVAYTPVLDFIPGYPGNKSRELLIENIMRLDSLDRQLSSMQIYSANVALIMDGKTPVIRSVNAQAADSLRPADPMVARNAADSVLRMQMEGSGVYRLSDSYSSGSKEGLALLSPVKGEITSTFDPKQGHFGVAISTATDQQVFAVKEGSVVLSVWSPTDGHVVQLQHTDNIVSTYKHLAATLAAPGSRVKAGQVIGNTGEGLSGEGGKGFFEFELWMNGTPVNPQTHIVF